MKLISSTIKQHILNAKYYIFFLFIFLLTGCGTNRWMGFYYPQGVGGETIYSNKDEFETPADCVNWVKNTASKKPPSSDFMQNSKDVILRNLYECGKNCELSDDSKYLLKYRPDSISGPDAIVEPEYICKSTFDGGDYLRGDYEK